MKVGKDEKNIINESEGIIELDLPLGIMPYNIWVLKRIRAIKEAVERYSNQNMIIPIEWINEYNKLISETHLNDV